MSVCTKIAAVLTAGILVLAGSYPARGQNVSEDRPKIAVTGEVVVYVQPDKILISLGVETWDSQMDAAKRKNDEIVKGAVAAIQQCGIDKKAIQLDEMSIHPTYGRDENGNWSRIIKGYTVENALVVTLTDVSLLESLITGALKAGVNHVHSVDFQTTELRKYRDQARQLALKAAREKAKDMAAVYDQSIGRPLQITENQGFGGGYRYWSWGWGGGWHGGGSRDYGMSQNVAVNAPSNGAGEGSDSMALGKIAIRANVNVVFELKDR